MLVLNATYEPINVCTVRRAAVLLLKEKAEIIEHSSLELRSEHATLPRPIVIMSRRRRDLPDRTSVLARIPVAMGTCLPDGVPPERYP